MLIVISQAIAEGAAAQAWVEICHIWWHKESGSYCNVTGTLQMCLLQVDDTVSSAELSIASDRQPHSMAAGHGLCDL